MTMPSQPLIDVGSMQLESKRLKISNRNSSIANQSRTSASSSSIVKDLPAKSVSFADRCRVRLIPAKTKEDHQNAWYQASQYTSFRTTCVRTLKSLIQRHQEECSMVQQIELSSPAAQPSIIAGISEDSMMASNDSWYGLEVYLPNRTKLRTQRRFLIWDVIMECQEQLKKGPKDWNSDWAMERCSMVSDASAVDARQSALILARELGLGSPTKGKTAIARAKSLPNQSILCDSLPRSTVEKATKRLVAPAMA